MATSEEETGHSPARPQAAGRTGNSRLRSAVAVVVAGNRDFPGGSEIDTGNPANRPKTFADAKDGDLGIFRPASALWAIRGVTRIYFGGSSDRTVPGDYDGNGTWSAGIFRPAIGLWAIRGTTRVYFGGSSDQTVPGDYAGTGNDVIGIFRPATGLWAIRGAPRVYFGASGDIPVSR